MPQQPLFQKKPGFFKHVFNENTQNELLNILQYVIFVVVPLIIITRNLNFFFPSLDKTKGNIELVAEALGQLSLTMIIILFLHRILTYFAPWGGGSIPAINFPTFIMLFLIISIGYGLGHVGKKIDYVWERLLPAPRANFWDADAKGTGKRAKKRDSIIKVTQPYAQLPPPIPTQQMGRADYITTQNQITPPLAPPASSAGQIPPQMGGSQQYGSGGNQQFSSMGQYTQSLDEAAMAQNAESQSKSQQNFNQMYATGNAGGGTFQEPMAANSVLGGFTSF